MKQSDKGLIIEYNVPIISRAEIDGDFTIEGIAINETITDNNHKFLGEELRASASTLVGVPLLKDHNNSVDAIVGRVKSASFNEINKNIPFRAIIKDPSMISKVRDGLINSVSVGAHVDPDDIEEDEDGSIIPRGIVFKELSLVAVGADSGATFDIALNNAYKGFKEKSEPTASGELNITHTSKSKDNSITTERGSMNMTEEESSKESEGEESQESETKEETKEETEEPKTDETSEKIFKLLTSMDKRMKKIESSDQDEVPRKEPKEEPKKEPKKEAKEEPEEEEEEDSEENVDEKAYTIIQKGNAFTMERKSYIYN